VIGSAKQNFFGACGRIAARLAAGSAVLALAGQPLLAQVAGSDPFNLPSDITLLAQNNPNVRKATAVVNGQPITGTDVDHRVALVLDANDAEVSAEELQRLRLQVLRNLIDETLQIQEARAQDIAVGAGEVDNSYQRVATQNFGQDTKALDAYLLGIGSSVTSLKRQIEGEMSWQRLLGRNVTPFVNVSEEEVNELLARLRDSKGSFEYQLGEIFLSASTETEAAVFENARKIVEQLRQGGSFVAYARQFSEASSAAVGGDLGWLRLPQLQSPELEEVVNTMQTGQLVGPVKVPGGFSIVFLRDRRQVLTADPRDALLSLKQISLQFPAGTSEAEAGRRAEEFAAAVQQIRGCGDADAAAAAIGATVVSNDQIPVRQMPEALQSILLQLNVGQTTPPFGALDEGVRVLMLCGRDDPQGSTGPSAEELIGQLEQERIEKRAQKYLRDLRRDAIVEYN
jgi:peptidyl-prolyl cis-trans isomerase SurA